MEEDFYKILGVSKSADVKEIKRAFRTIAKSSHPDHNPDNPEAEERFKRASVAFEVLSDDRKRKLYDEFGMDGLRDGFDAVQARQYQSFGGGRYQSSSSYDDIFGSVFDGRSPFDTSHFSDFGGFQTAPLKGRDIDAWLKLGFMTALEGGEMDVTVAGKTIRARIPAGATNGDKLRLRGQGEKSRGAKAGDLILTLKVEKHALLRREDLNLFIDLPITFGEAVHGAKIDVPTPSGSYSVSIPSGVHSGAKLRLKGKGVKRGKKTGDFFVIVMIHAPDVIDEEIESLIDDVDRGYSESIRSKLKL